MVARRGREAERKVPREAELPRGELRISQAARRMQQQRQLPRARVQVLWVRRAAVSLRRARERELVRAPQQRCRARADKAQSARPIGVTPCRGKLLFVGEFLLCFAQARTRRAFASLSHLGAHHGRGVCRQS